MLNDSTTFSIKLAEAYLLTQLVLWRNSSLRIWCHITSTLLGLLLLDLFIFVSINDLSTLTLGNVVMATVVVEGKPKCRYERRIEEEISRFEDVSKLFWGVFHPLGSFDRPRRPVSKVFRKLMFVSYRYYHISVGLGLYDQNMQIVCCLHKYSLWLYEPLNDGLIGVLGLLIHCFRTCLTWHRLGYTRSFIMSSI